MTNTITLTPRQRTIAELVADDLSNKEIAAQLGISLQTVKNILCAVQAKLGTRSRAGIAAVVAGRTIDEEIEDLEEQIANLQKRLEQLLALKVRQSDVMHYAEADPSFLRWRSRRMREGR